MKFRVIITIEDTDDGGVAASADYTPPVDPTTFQPTPAFTVADAAMKAIDATATAMGGVPEEVSS